MAEKVNHLAGIMAVGHHITPNMLIPPQLDMYSIAGLCSGDCTDKVISDAPMHELLNYYYILLQFLPSEGISVFGGLLHTHLAGKNNGLAILAFDYY